MVVMPRTRIVAPAPGIEPVRVTCTPDIEPWSACETLVARTRESLSPPTLAIEPLRSAFLIVP